MCSPFSYDSSHDMFDKEIDLAPVGVGDFC